MSDSSADTVPKEPSSEDNRKALIGGIISASCFIVMIGLATIVYIILDKLPRTDDAYVRANVIGIAPHVSGRIVELNVVDDQPVKKGDLLFIVDPRPYEYQLVEAIAALELTKLEVDGYKDAIVAAEGALVESEAQAKYAREYYEALKPLAPEDYVSPIAMDQALQSLIAADAAVLSAKAMLAQAVSTLGQYGDTNAYIESAKAKVDDARLYLEYCMVKAPVDGYVTNLNISAGEYANAGQQVFAMVDRTIWYVMAYFKETYLKYLKPGMEVEIYFMAYPNRKFTGHVQSLGWALYQDNGSTVDLLPEVAPSLDWVRLAQRFPVRIVVDEQKGYPIRMGETASVIVHPSIRVPDAPFAIGHAHTAKQNQ